MANAKITIEVAYATPTKQWIIPLEINTPISIQEAIIQSDILTQCPEINLMQLKVGIFGQLLPLDTLVKSGDRVEIYRPLEQSAIEKRFQRVGKKRR